MYVNYKNLFYIFHSDGKFTEEQLIKTLDAAYQEGRKKGYDEGYEVGKNSSFYLGYPYSEWWKYPYYKTDVTCKNTTGDAVVPTGTTTSINSNPSSKTTTTSTFTIKPMKPYGMEFKYNGTEK